MPLQKQGAAVQAPPAACFGRLLSPFSPATAFRVSLCLRLTIMRSLTLVCSGAEAYKALKMLVALRGQLPPEEREEADRLVEVMSSRLFGALLGASRWHDARHRRPWTTYTKGKEKGKVGMVKRNGHGSSSVE